MNKKLHDKIQKKIDRRILKLAKDPDLLKKIEAEINQEMKKKGNWLKRYMKKAGKLAKKD